MRVLEILLMLALILPAASIAVATQGSGMERRSHFRLRLACISLSMPAVLCLLVGGATLNVLPHGAVGVSVLLLIVLCIPGLMLLPSVLFNSPGSPPEDGGDDGGSGPSRPPDPPAPPRGDLPLPQSEPGRWRLRDRHRPDLRRLPRRRPLPERRRERTLR